MEVRYESKDIELKIFDINKKLLSTVIWLFIVLISGACIRVLIFQQYKIAYIFLPISILILVFIQIAIFKTKNNYFLLFLFVFLILVSDSIILFSAISQTFDNNYPIYVRYLYIFTGSTMIMLMSRVDLSFKFSLLLLLFKFCFMGYLLSYYDLKEKIYIYYEISFFLVATMSCVFNNTSKSFFLKNLDKIYNKNKKLLFQYRSILNSMKDPLVSINLVKSTIIFNNSLKQLLIESDFNKYEIEYLLSTHHHKLDINYDYITLNKYEHLYNKKGKTKISEFQKKLSILSNIFSKFTDETTSNHLNLSDYIESDKNFEENEEFQKIGSFSFNSSSITEQVYEISWRKSLFNEKEVFLDFIFNDITNVRKIESTNADNKYRKIYLAKVAHEFKTPINTLLYSLNKLLQILKDQPTSNQLINEQINFIEGQANYITVLISDINDYCKESKDLLINIDEIKLKPILDFSYQTLNSLLKKDPLKSQNVKAFLKCSAEVPETINTDEKRLKQLLVNLISNSVKFTNKGKISIIVDYNNQSNFIFCVEDTGIGIPENEINKVFKEYQEINKSHYYLNKEGTGLGLSICKKIIDKLRGKISCESHPGLTKFTFTLNENYNLIDKSITISRNLDKEILCEYYPNDFNTSVLLNKENYPNKTNQNEDTIILRNNAKKESIKSQNSKSTIKVKSLFINKSKIESEISQCYKISEEDRKSNILMEINSSSQMDEIEICPMERSFNQLIRHMNFNNMRSNFYYFSRPLVKYMKLVLNFDRIILIIDDEISNSKSLKKLIKLYMNNHGIFDIGVMYIFDPIEALYVLMMDNLLNLKVTLIFSDLNMKFLNGDVFVNLLKRIKFNHICFSRIILVTASDSDTLSYLKDLGISKAVQRPISYSDILKILKSLNY